MRAQARPRAPPNLAATVLRMGAHTLWDSVTRPLAREAADVPYTIEAVTPQWLTAAICKTALGAQVESFELGARTSGSTVRRRIDLTYCGKTDNLDLPASVFAKSSPTLFNRIALTVSRTIENEALFYERIRPLVTLEAPRGYHCGLRPPASRRDGRSSCLTRPPGLAVLCPAAGDGIEVERISVRAAPARLSARHGDRRHESVRRDDAAR